MEMLPKYLHAFKSGFCDLALLSGLTKSTDVGVLWGAGIGEDRVNVLKVLLLSCCNTILSAFIWLWSHLTWQPVKHKSELITPTFNLASGGRIKLYQRRGSVLLQNDLRTEWLKRNRVLILHSFTHQVSTEHEEADEVDVGQVAPAGELFTRLSVGFWVTASTGQSCQHNLLPLLSSGTPTRTQRHGSIFIQPSLQH